MYHEANPFNNPDYGQQAAWQTFNTAMGALALNYSIDMDQLAETVGRYTEEIISVLRDGGEPAPGVA